MSKKEFKVGEVFQCGLVKLKCIKYCGIIQKCDACFFGYTECSHKILGSCSKINREDKTDVIFVKVED